MIHQQRQLQQTIKIMKKGTYVSMYVEGEDIFGTAIEDESNSPTEKEPYRTVIRIKWDDGSESIERADALYQLSKSGGDLKD